MSEFRDAIHERIRETFESLQTARGEQDDFLIDLREGDLTRLQHLAAEHDVDVPVAYQLGADR